MKKEEKISVVVLEPGTLRLRKAKVPTADLPIDERIETRLRREMKELDRLMPRWSPSIGHKGFTI